MKTLTIRFKDLLAVTQIDLPPKKESGYNVRLESNKGMILPLNKV